MNGNSYYDEHSQLQAKNGTGDHLYGMLFSLFILGIMQARLALYFVRYAPSEPNPLLTLSALRPAHTHSRARVVLKTCEKCWAGFI